MRGHILLVEDNEKLNVANKRMLELEGYSVTVAKDIGEAEAAVKKQEPDVIVLDILLPDGSGFDFGRKISKKTDSKILFLSSLNQNTDIVQGLNLGGDDYLTKPFDYAIFLARINALMRRNKPNTEETIKKIGPYTFDHNSLHVFKNGKDLLLVPKEYGLFRVLAENVNDYVTPEELYSRVWGREANGDVRTIYPHISRLRSKLDLDGAMKIEQKRGIGYRLVMMSLSNS